MTVANLSIPQQYILDIEPEGRLTLPQEIQQILNLESGDRLIGSSVCVMQWTGVIRDGTPI
ncbi:MULTISPECIES: hypothetical protein [Microcystis]|uniref:hypothetical protein n=1 Tax=Microcystis TaxID=1125 RepID=UPI001F54B8E3|nr:MULTISPECIES: hypothetical protein [Microcystis]UZO77275.1 hypothetical protein M8120_04580 [Microcystis aeruginosa str. Chao 1910]